MGPWWGLGRGERMFFSVSVSDNERDISSIAKCVKAALGIFHLCQSPYPPHLSLP